MPTTAKTLATYDHPFFGTWPAITRNTWGKGTLTYEGTALTGELQQAVVQDALRESGIPFDSTAPASPVRIKRGVADGGRQITYLLNYSSTAQTVPYAGPAAHDLLTKQAVDAQVGPRDVVIAESDAR